MKVHPSNTDQEILENVDHLAGAEEAMNRLHPADFDNFNLRIVLRALIRSIEILQQTVANLKKQT